MTDTGVSRRPTVPLVVWWVLAVPAAAIAAFLLSFASNSLDSAQERVDLVEEWQGTTFVTTGTFQSLGPVQEVLPFSFDAEAAYVITVPRSATTGAGQRETVQVSVGGTSRRAPTAAGQPRTLALRVTDDADREVVEARPTRLRSAADELVVARDLRDQKSTRHTVLSAVLWGAWGLGLLLVAALTFGRPGRARRFAGSRVPASVGPPDGPYSPERWAVRQRVLPALEKDALSWELPAGTFVTAVVLVFVGVLARGPLPTVLVLAAASLVCAALWLRELHAVELRRDWAWLGRESGMGPAPDTDRRVRARSGGTTVRLLGIAGVAVGLLALLLGGLRGLVTQGLDRGGSTDPMFAIGGLLVVTSGTALAAGLLQVAESRRERAAFTPTANEGTSTRQ